ncbi:tol-pal system protein YbgF [Nisaea nitritireducens]|uniref:tol-pal system protein YbgF n=1 Tax=Nisaea nitritireducens TaxID=568392 RepID=UPI001866F26C|nr:tol-pal system protein YbgF [Nisaea nitritireducens]
MTSRFVFGGARLFAGAVALMFISAAALPAAAQDVQNLLNRLDRMEREMQDLQRQLYRGGGTGITATPVTPAPITSGTSTTSATAGNQSAGFDTSYAARVEVRLQQLETLIRSLTGKIEEVEFKVEQNSGRLDRLVRDIDFRLQALERGGVATQPDSAVQGSLNRPVAEPAPAEAPVAGQGQGVLGYLKESEAKALDAAPAPAAEAGQVPAPASAPETVASTPSAGPQQILPEGTPEEQYKHAFTYLQKQDFASAEQALSAFLERHPKNPLAGNAMYWLGETYYVRKDFANAAKTFATGYTDYPGSSKTADNLLKLGFSLARMDRKEDACVTFDQLKTDFPNASANIKRRMETERQRIGC